MVFPKFTIKNSNDLYALSASILIIVFLVAHFIAKSVPSIDSTLSDEIQKAVITTDGVLFGFTGVMVGLFARTINSFSNQNLKRLFLFAMLAFLSFVFSMLFSFLLVAFGQETLQMAPLTPLIVIVFGAFCASIFILLTFYDNVFPQGSK